MLYLKYNVLKLNTNNTALLWGKTRGVLQNAVAQKMDIAMFDWQVEMTSALKIWIDKGSSLTSGELILAYANLGAIVEFWLKFFYCVNYIDYLKKPLKNKDDEIVEPEQMKFEALKNYSMGILWEDKQSKERTWVDSIQHKRNAIHTFLHKDIGDPETFLEDVENLYTFIEKIMSHLPPLEDFIDVYPEGYVFNIDYSGIVE